ncbi:MAG: glycosyltransferase family 1 protein [Clostridia bacterium]
MSKPKVLIFVDRMRVGGIQTLLYNQYPYFDKVDVEFLVLDDGEHYDLEDDIKKLGGTIHKLEKVWLRSPLDYVNYAKKMKEFFKNNHDYVAVHMNSGSKNYMFLQYAKKYGIPVRISHSHNTNFQSTSKAQILLGNMMKVPMKKYSTHLFACSDLAGQWLFGENEKVIVIPNGVNLDKYGFNKAVRERLRKELNVEKNIVIGNVGRFVNQKNHTKLINIFNEIQKKEPTAVLILAGIGELMEQTQKQVDDLKISDKVKFLGFRTDVNDLIQAMDVFLMPSFFEGFPVTGVEAQASGLPCVFSDTITRQAAILEETAYIPLEESNKIWAEKILSLIGKVDREHSKKSLKDKGFDLPDMVGNIESYYLQKK